MKRYLNPLILTGTLVAVFPGPCPARDTAAGAPRSEADRSVLVDIVLETWTRHVDADDRDQWLERIQPLLESADLARLEDAATALDFDRMEAALNGIAIDGEAQPDSFGAAGGNLVFFPLTPCRILDTRQASASAGQITAGTSRQFYGYATDFQVQQGGDNSNCGLPATTSPEALAINLTAVNAPTAGYLTTWAVGGTQPLAASLTYKANEVISNEVIVPINNSLGVREWEVFSLRDVHVVADVVGYFSRPETAPLNCQRLASAPISIGAGAVVGGNSPQCADSYSVTGGSCIGAAGLSLVTTREAQNVPAWFCSYRNDSAAVHEFRAEVKCCRSPGR